MKIDLKKVKAAYIKGRIEGAIALACFEGELKQKYAKLCETRIGNMKDDAVAFFIEELLNAEAEEILDVKQ